ncbi:outer membrane protein assembly factor BamA, partial [bacterium]|nr:outer membrane protein assembly factor BamA [bacterium]
YYREKEYYQAEVAPVPERQGRQVSLVFEIQEGMKVKVANIKVSGNQAFSEGKVKGFMETKTAGWFIGGTYKEETFLNDLKKILLGYAKEGYLKAVIFGYGLQDIDLHRQQITEQALTVNRETKEMTIHLRLEEGAQYCLGKLTYKGNIIFSEEELLSRMRVKSGAIMDRLAFEKDMHMIRMTYSEKGYIFSDISPEMEYQDDAGIVDITVRIRESTIARVEKISIRGNTTTKDKVIRRELNIQPGEAFDSRKIQRSREKMMNLGFFQDVKVTTEPGSTPAEQILIFEVEERHTGTISLGAGYSSVDNLMGYLQLTEANLFGNGQSVSLQWELGSKRQSWQMSFTEPWLFDSPVSFGVDVWNSNKKKGYGGQDYNLLSQGGDIRLGRRFNEWWSGYLKYKLESNEYTDVSTTDIPIGRMDTSSITPTLSYDTRDNIFNATRGTYQRLSVEFAGAFLGGDYNYMKYMLDSSYFLPLIWNFVLAFHGELGYANAFRFGVTGLTDVPPDERFRVGGTDTVRGYDEGVFGRKYTGGGGLVELVTNIELHYPIIGPLKGVAFFDAGNTWEDVAEFANHPSLYKGVGMGIRLTIPGTVMLIRFDFGYPLDPDPPLRDEKLVFHFNIGNIF